LVYSELSVFAARLVCRNCRTGGWMFALGASIVFIASMIVWLGQR
jgi:hypothetical protein